MGWFGKKSESNSETSQGTTPLQRVEQFLFSYDRAGSKKTQYAMALWGIDAAFQKIFGGLDGFHRSEPSKQSRYLQMIGNNSLEAIKSDRMIVAECNKAFLDFLVATKKTPRGMLRGSIAIYADRLDGIIRFGKGEIDRVGKMEEDVKEFIASDAPFAIGSGVVRGAVTEKNVVAASQLIINELQKVLSSHEDYHRFIIEQYARLRLEPGIRTMLDGVPLFDIELSVLGPNWSKNSPAGIGVACVDAMRPQIHDWCRVTVPSLAPGELSLRVVGAAYGHFRVSAKPYFDQIRRGYAEIFRDQCSQSGHHQAADLWEEVVKSIPHAVV